MNDDKLESEIRRDCMLAMKDLLGEGYTQDYYESAASDFVALILHYYSRGASDAKKTGDSSRECGGV